MKEHPKLMFYKNFLNSQIMFIKQVLTQAFEEERELEKQKQRIQTQRVIIPLPDPPYKKRDTMMVKHLQLNSRGGKSPSIETANNITSQR